VAARSLVTYKNPPAVSVTQPAFNGELRDNQFIAHMIQHFPTCDEARVSVDAYLKSWEITASLKTGNQGFAFVYGHCDVVDRDPPPGTIHELSVRLQGRITVASSATVSITRGSYPDPPPAFSITPSVEMLWNRHRRFASGNEPLFSMAYFCLTALERSSGRRREAAARYNIDFTVLDKIGELSSTRRGPADARKVVNTVLTYAGYTSRAGMGQQCSACGDTSGRHSRSRSMPGHTYHGIASYLDRLMAL
jgi:hypothetical protein